MNSEQLRHRVHDGHSSDRHHDEHPMDRLHSILLERVESSDYPSLELMDRVEQTLSDRDQAVRYAHVLFDKITRYPSLHILDRLAALIARIEDDC
ncbi:MAG TPA: hypothetical protein VF516_01340 [Kofleriaceae bacterium]